MLDSVAGDIRCDGRRSRWLTVRGMVSYWGLSRESTVEEIAARADELADPAHRARVRAFEGIMRLHLVIAIRTYDPQPRAIAGRACMHE